MKTRLMLALMLAILLPTGLCAQFIKIYHLGIGHGDCTLIVAEICTDATCTNKEKISILIDTGEPPIATVSTLWTDIKRYLTADGLTKVNYFIISHFDSDHMKIAGRLLNLMRTDGANFHVGMTVIDRLHRPSGSGVYQSRKLPKGKIYKEYRDAIKHYANYWPPIPGSYLYNYPKFKMLCVAANGYVISNAPATPTRVVTGKPKAENDLSIAWIIEFGAFRYFTGGDLPGTGSGHYDLETPLVTHFRALYPATKTTPYHFCCFKLSHHGSATSTRQQFVQYFLPSLGIVPAAQRSFNGTRLPVMTTIQRMRRFADLSAAPKTDWSCKLYYTYVPSPADNFNTSRYDPIYWTATSRASMCRDVLVHVTTMNAPISMAIGYKNRDRKTLVEQQPGFTPKPTPETCDRH